MVHLQFCIIKHQIVQNYYVGVGPEKVMECFDFLGIVFFYWQESFKKQYNIWRLLGGQF